MDTHSGCLSSTWYIGFRSVQSPNTEFNQNSINLPTTLTTCSQKCRSPLQGTISYWMASLPEGAGPPPAEEGGMYCTEFIPMDGFGHHPLPSDITKEEPNRPSFQRHPVNSRRVPPPSPPPPLADYAPASEGVVPSPGGLKPLVDLRGEQANAEVPGKTGKTERFSAHLHPVSFDCASAPPNLPDPGSPRSRCHPGVAYV